MTDTPIILPLIPTEWETVLKKAREAFSRPWPPLPAPEKLRE